jgi:hypothetical protein
MNAWSSLRLGCEVAKHARRAYSTMTSRRMVTIVNGASLSNDSVRNLSTQEHIIKSPYSDISVPDITLVDLVWDAVDRFPDSTALVSTNEMDRQPSLLS